MTALAKPRRSRANLRPPSRSACVIDRLRKNQDPLEKRNNFRSSSPHLVVGRRPENRAAIFRSEISWIREPWLFRSLVFGSGIHASTASRSAVAASQGGSRAGWRLRQSNHLAPALSSTGDGSCPHHAILDRKIAARLFRRFPRPVKARTIPDSYFPSMGSAFTETASPPTADREGGRKLTRLRTRCRGSAMDAVHRLLHPSADG